MPSIWIEMNNQQGLVRSRFPCRGTIQLAVAIIFVIIVGTRPEFRVICGVMEWSWTRQCWIVRWIDSIAFHDHIGALHISYRFQMMCVLVRIYWIAVQLFETFTATSGITTRINLQKSKERGKFCNGQLENSGRKVNWSYQFASTTSSTVHRSKANNLFWQFLWEQHEMLAFGIIAFLRMGIFRMMCVYCCSYPH